MSICLVFFGYPRKYSTWNKNNFLVYFQITEIFKVWKTDTLYIFLKLFWVDYNLKHWSFFKNHSVFYLDLNFHRNTVLTNLIPHFF